MYPTFEEFINERFQDITKIYVTLDIEAATVNNPYIKLLYGNLLDKTESITRLKYLKPSIRKLYGEKSILHQHWLEVENLVSFFIVTVKICCAILFKIFGGEVVWTVHNFHPHSNRFKRINEIYYRFYFKLANFIHVHNESTLPVLEKSFSFKRNKVIIIPHPKYETKKISKEDCQKHLKRKYNNFDFDSSLYLVFGVITEYKGIEELIEVFNTCQRKLFIIGRSISDSYSEALKKLILGENIFILTEYISEEDVPYWFNLVDYVVFNYREILTSGGIQLAMDYDKKIIARKHTTIENIKYDNILWFKDKNELKKILI